MEYNKYDLIELILLDLKGTTGINFQYKVREVLKKCYKDSGKTYEMPRHYGGDKKNDGWVKDNDLYYQIFSPAQKKANTTLKKDILQKFEEDLGELLEILYVQKLWSKNLKKFVFIVNTFDVPLPEDSSSEYDKVVRKLSSKYSVKFDYEISNLDYIREVLEEVENEKTLLSIASALRIRHLLNNEVCSADEVYEVICKISSKISEEMIINNCSKNYYKRISSDSKIEINNLGDYKDKIDLIISKLYIVEKAIKLINEELEDIDRFEVTKNYIVEKYKELEKKLKGIELYEKIIEESSKILKHAIDFRIPIEFLVVYIFDKCDIFKKEEEVQNDFT